MSCITTSSIEPILCSLSIHFKFTLNTATEGGEVEIQREGREQMNEEEEEGR